MLTRPAAQLSVECVWRCSQELETQTQISNTHREYPLPSCLVMLVLRSFSLYSICLSLSLSHSWFDCATLISNFERTFVPLLVPPQLCVCHQQLPQPLARPLTYFLDSHQIKARAQINASTRLTSRSCLPSCVLACLTLFGQANCQLVVACTFPGRWKLLWETTHTHSHTLWPHTAGH